MKDTNTAMKYDPNTQINYVNDDNYNEDTIVFEPTTTSMSYDTSSEINYHNETDEDIVFEPVDTTMDFIVEIEKLLSANYKENTLYTYSIPKNTNVLIFCDENKQAIGSVPTIVDFNNSTLTFHISEEDSHRYELIRDFNNDLFNNFDDNRETYDGLLDYL